MFQTGINNYKNTLLYFLLITSILLCFQCSGKNDISPVRKTRVLMDTFVSITIYDNNKSQLDINNAIDAAFAGLEKVEKITNNYSDSSEISLVNRARNKTVTISDPLEACITEAQRVAQMTRGSFDISIGPLISLWKFGTEENRVPEKEEIRAALQLVDYNAVEFQNRQLRLTKKGMSVDLGGIAKGLAVDVAVDSLKVHGISDAMIDTGSNLRTIVSELTAGKRNVWVRHPRNRSELFARFPMDEGCVATSGDYERYFIQDSIRYHHILDPHTGRPARGCVSLTVVANSGLEADALSTALFVMGPDRGLELVKTLSGVEAVYLVENGDAIEWIASEGLQNIFEIVNKQ